MNDDITKNEARSRTCKNSGTAPCYIATDGDRMVGGVYDDGTSDVSETLRDWANKGYEIKKDGRKILLQCTPTGSLERTRDNMRLVAHVTINKNDKETLEGFAKEIDSAIINIRQIIRFRFCNADAKTRKNLQAI